MIKEWATVVSWQDGVALVSCDVKASCSSCASRAGCGSRVLNKLGPQTSHTIAVPSDQPLFVMGGVFQMLFGTDLAALCGAALGGVGGFWLAKGVSPRLVAREAWQPVILSVALAPDQLRVETLSSEAR